MKWVSDFRAVPSGHDHYIEVTSWEPLRSELDFFLRLLRTTWA